MKDKIYDELIVKDTTIRFYNYLFINRYSSGVDYPIQTDYDCDKFFQDDKASSIVDSIRKDFGLKYNIKKEKVLTLPDCYRDKINIYIGFPWYSIDREQFVSKFLTDTMFFGIDYKKTESYRYKCLILQDKEETTIQLMEIHCSYGKIKDSYDDEKIIRRGEQLFDRKIIRRLK